MLVNASNRSCLGGNDRAVAARGGAALKAAREALPLLGPKAQQTRCKPGGAVITVGGGLGAKWCVHAVGPDYRSEKGANGEPLPRDACDRLVSRAHAQALARAQDKGAATVAFALLSAGAARGAQPLEAVLGAAVRGVRRGAYAGLEAVRLPCSPVRPFGPPCTPHPPLDPSPSLRRLSAAPP